jgi:hypothetical protein
VAFPLLRAGLLTAASAAPVSADLVMAGAAILLLIGFSTPIAAGLIAVVELALAWWHPDDPWPFVQFAAMSAALALLGPGGCSADAHLFGRKRIEIPKR